MNEKKNWFSRAFGSFWRGVDRLRRFTFNLLFLLLAVLLLAALFRGGELAIPASTALVLRPEGVIVDQLEGEPLERALAELGGRTSGQTLLADLLTAIERAREDERVKVLVLELDALEGAGLSKLQELSRAIEAFKASGKPVVARAELLDHARYRLAASADEIYLVDSGLVLLTGFANYRSYFQEGLERLEVDANVIRVGEYKTAVEPFLRNDMSPEARDANLDWLGDLWDHWVEDVAALRGMDATRLRGFVEGYNEHLRRAEGDAARAALEAGLVDHAAPRHAADQRIAELLEWTRADEEYPQVEMDDYLLATGAAEAVTLPGRDAVGLIVASGTIVDGDQPPGTIGSISLSRLIRDARRDPDLKAVVLRVDSGGGSALASEVIRTELERLRQAGKPLVVSMGSVAASGGYWISTAADEIWASPTTLTGSIGIFALFPTFQRPLANHLGVHVDGVSVGGPLAGTLRLDREMAPALREAMTLWLERGYRDFLQRVAEARDMTVEDVDAIARGRVWSGEDAARLGLVDHLGGLEQALAAAAERGGLGKDFAVRRIEDELTLRERLLLDALSATAGWLPAGSGAASPAGPLVRLERQARSWLRLAAQLNDPAGLYAHCLCGVP